MENKKETLRKWLKIAIIIIVIFELGLMGYVLSGKLVKNNDNDADIEDIDDNTNDQEVIIKLEPSFNLKECAVEVGNREFRCEKTIRLGNEDVSFSYEKKYTDDDPSSTKTSTDIIKIRNKDIYNKNNVFFATYGEVYVLGDIVIITYRQGTDIRGDDVLFLNRDGEILNLRGFDAIYPISMALIPDEEGKVINIFNSTITFHASRMTNGLVVLSDGEELGDTHICNTNPPQIISAVYEVKYLGNGELSDITRKSAITQTEYVIKEKIKCE